MNPSLLLIPDRYKASKLYSQIPDSGAGDLAFTRANDTATRVNSAGLIEKVRTNLFPDGSALTTSWNANVGGTLTAGQTDPNGGTTALRIQLAAGSSSVADYFTGSAFSYARSAFIKGATAQSIRIADPFTGTGTTINLTTSYQRFSRIGAGSGGNFGIAFDNNNDSAAKDFTIAFVQIEEGDVMTDYIPTTTAAVSVGPVANIPRIDYTGGGCGKLLLEPQRTNLALYSEQFDNGYFGKVNTAINANVLASPDGFVNADKLVATATTGAHFLIVPVALGSPAVLSVFAKAAEETLFAIGNATGSQAVVFDLSNGTITSGTDGAIENYGNGWYRCSYYRTSWADFQYFSLRGNTPSYTGNGTDGLFLYGAQFEAGAYPTSYIPTLGASVTRSADAASKTGISSLIGQQEGTLFAELTFQSGAIPIFIGSSISGSAGEATYVEFDTSSVVAWVYKGGVLQAQMTASGFTNGQNFKLAVGYKLNDFALYVNGTQRATDTSGDVSTSLTNLSLNTYPLIPSTFQYNGKYSQFALYPVRLSNSELASLTTL